MVVFDLERSIAAYSAKLGVGPWTVYTLGPGLLKDMVYRGAPASFRFRHALTVWGDLQLELLEPLEGPSIYSEHLERHGEGLHHLGSYVSDIAVAVEELQRRGFTMVQSARGFGRNGDGAFAYFETDDPLGAVFEVIEPPAVRIDPDFVTEAPSDAEAQDEPRGVDDVGHETFRRTAGSPRTT